jgi:hypothetical protein
MLAIAAASALLAGPWTVSSTEIEFRFAGKLGWRVLETIQVRQGSRSMEVRLQVVRHSLTRTASPSYARGEAILLSRESGRLTRFEIRRA